MQNFSRRVSYSGLFGTYKVPVPDSVPSPQTAGFELGRRAIERCITAVLAALDEAEVVPCGQDFVDVLRVVEPVGGDVKRAARLEGSCGQVQERRLDDAPFVVPFFRPGIRVENKYA